MPDSSFKQFLLKEAQENFHYHLGNAALVLNRFDEACELYERALACCPEHARASVNLAKALRRLEQHPKAAEIERAAKALNPFAWADAEHDLAKLDAIHGHVEEAVKKYQRILEERPHHQETLFEVMKLLFQKREIIEAAQYYIKLCDLDMEYIPTSFHVAMASNLLSIDVPERAIDTLRHILKTDPDSAEALDYLSHAYMGAGRFAEAQDALEKILARAPNDAPRKIKLAVALAGQKKDDQAAALLRPLIETPSGGLWVQSAALMHFGFLLERQGRKEEGFSYLQKAAALESGWAWPEINLNAAIYRRGRIEEAATGFHKIISTLRHEDNVGRCWANLQYGRALWTLGRQEAARTAFRQGMNGYYALCWSHWLQGLDADAPALLEEAKATLE